MTHFAIYTTETSIDGIGTGITEADAMAEARYDAADRAGCNVGDLDGVANPCTEDLYRAVDADGGIDVRWYYNDSGVAALAE